MSNDYRKHSSPSGEYAIYLRKSRADLDAEAHGEGETLERHRVALMELAQRRGLSIGAVYDEIVSGETIAARPKMQQLLTEVEEGLWKGVLVMEVERLARGETIDQGIVAQAFKYSNTLIITPMKTYDPSNEFDEEYFEFGLFMSRREYKTINRRLQAGRRTSAKEGKWLGGKVPYGYDSCKLPREKGYSLVPNQDADTIRTLFQLFTSDPRLGTIKLANKLNELGYRSATGKPFNVGIVKEILHNPLYAGYITYGRRAIKKTMRGGDISYQYPRAKEYPIYKGRHEPLISEEVWQATQSKLAARSFHPIRHNKNMQNPFVGLLICQKCGHKMQARPNAHGGRTVFCYHYCGIVSSTMDEVEAALLHALRAWLCNYTAQSQAAEVSDAPAKAASEASLIRLQTELAAVQEQLSRAFEFVETGVYTPEIFAERQKVLAARQESITQAISHCEAELDYYQQQELTRDRLIPAVTHVIEVYEQAQTAQEKNELLKSVLKRVEYQKSRPASDPQGSDLQLTLYPFIPRADR